MILVLHEGGLVSMPLLGQVIDPGPVVAVIRGEEVDDVPEAAFGPRRAVVPADAKKKEKKKKKHTSDCKHRSVSDKGTRARNHSARQKCRWS